MPKHDPKPQLDPTTDPNNPPNSPLNLANVGKIAVFGGHFGTDMARQVLAEMLSGKMNIPPKMFDNLTGGPDDPVKWRWDGSKWVRP